VASIGSTSPSPGTASIGSSILDRDSFDRKRIVKRLWQTALANKARLEPRTPITTPRRGVGMADTVNTARLEVLQVPSD